MYSVLRPKKGCCVPDGIEIVCVGTYFHFVGLFYACVYHGVSGDTYVSENVHRRDFMLEDKP